MPNDKRRLVSQWNRILKLMKTTEANWDLFRESVGNFSPQEIEECPIGLQKAIALFGKAKFDIFLPRFIEYYRRHGGIEELEVKMEKGD